MGLSTRTLPSMDRGRLCPGVRPGHPSPHGTSRLGRSWSACAKRALRFSRCGPASSRLRRTVLLVRRSFREAGFLLSPVMIFLRPWFAWRFQELTGEIFFARSPRAGRAGSNAREFAGLKSPVPKGQVIDLERDFGAKISRRKICRAMGPWNSAAGPSPRARRRARPQGNRQGLKALFRKIKLLILKRISAQKFFAGEFAVRLSGDAVQSVSFHAGEDGRVERPATGARGPSTSAYVFAALANDLPCSFPCLTGETSNGDRTNCGGRAVHFFTRGTGGYQANVRKETVPS